MKQPNDWVVAYKQIKLILNGWKSYERKKA